MVIVYKSPNNVATFPSDLVLSAVQLMPLFMIFILGITWLGRVGDVIFNWQKQEIRFWDSNTLIKLQGVRSPFLNRDSLKGCLEGQCTRVMSSPLHNMVPVF